MPVQMLAPGGRAGPLYRSRLDNWGEEGFIRPQVIVIDKRTGQRLNVDPWTVPRARRG